MNRRLRVVGIALAAVFALSAFVASAAQAYTWTEAGSEIMESEVIPSNSTNFTLTSVVLGAELELEATGLECKEAGTCGISSETNGGGGKNNANDSGALSFTGVTVIKPAGCTILNGKVETTALNTQLVSVPALPSELADKFTPASGETGTFATVKVRNCAAAGNYPVKGTIVGETEAVGVELETQPLRFSPAISAAAGTELKLGPEPAYLTGTGSNTLPSGAVWGANAE